MAEVMYKNAGGAEAQPEAGPAAGDAPGGDGVVDAEFTEVKE